MNITDSCLPYKFPSIRVDKTTNMWCVLFVHIQSGSNMTGTDLCVNKCKQSRSYLNHLVCSF